LKDGSRKVTAITEVAGMEGDTVVLTDIFKFEQTDIGEGGKIEGTIKPRNAPDLWFAIRSCWIQTWSRVFGATIAEVMEKNRKH
jgi:pilus assembly protein CpaF